MVLATAAGSEFITPTQHDAQLAAESLRQLEPLLNTDESTLELTITNVDGPVHIVLPRAALKAFTQMMSTMAEGNAFTVIPVHAALSTKQAADILNVSRPFLIGLLEQKAIPFHMVGSHRRVLLRDLMDYRAKIDKRRAECLNELARISQEDEMGYGP
jgi:excisionase family DNA binding protein